MAWFPWMENVDWQRKIEAEAKSYGQYLREKAEFELEDFFEEVRRDGEGTVPVGFLQVE